MATDNRESPLSATVQAVSDLLQTQVDPTDNFFVMGGDSLIAVELVTRLGEAGLDVRLMDVFSADSIASIAAKATRHGA